MAVNLLEELKKNPFVLSPMAGITDSPFRSFMREMGCGIVVSELVSATGLRYSSEKTRRLMHFSEAQRPVGIQLFGDDINDLAFAASEVEQMGADFVDLNFGCPVPKVVKKGGGAAMLKDLPNMQQVLRAVKNAVKIPVTIKIRTGWDATTRNALDVTRLAHDEGILWVAIHGRTRAQGYSGSADWDFIGSVRAQAPLPVLGNGDISSPKQAIERLQQTGCPGVLIGRGALKNPFIFQEAKRNLNPGQSTKSEVPRDLNATIHRLRHHLEYYDNERMISLQLKKFAAWYSTGQTGAAQFRKEIFQFHKPDEVLKLIVNYFSNLPRLVETDLLSEPLLTAGEG